MITTNVCKITGVIELFYQIRLKCCVFNAKANAMVKPELIINKRTISLRECRVRAISTVLTTMIILVASVVIAVSAVIYGTSLFQTKAQLEVIAIKGTTAWVNSTNSSGVAWGAVAVTNSGDKLVAIDRIEIRSEIVPFTNWFVDKNQTAVTVENYLSKFDSTGNDSAGMLHDSEDIGITPSSQCASDTTNDASTLEIDLDGTGPKPTLCLLQASGQVSLPAGQKLIMYFRLPDGLVDPLDTGRPINIGTFAGKTGAPITTIIGNL